MLLLVLLSSVESERSEYSVFSVSFVLLSHTLGKKTKALLKIPLGSLSFGSLFSRISHHHHRREEEEEEDKEEKVK